MNRVVTTGSYGSQDRPMTIVIDQHGRVTGVVQLPTLGGTAIDAQPLAPIPRSAWGIGCLAVLILAWCVRRPRAAAAPASKNFRSHPADDVMLVSTEA